MEGSARVTKARWVVTLGAMASYIDGATMVGLGIAVVFFIPEFDLNAWEVGALVSGLQLTFSIGALIGGRLGDVFGRRSVYSFDLLVYAAGVLTVVLAPNTMVLFVGIIVTGLAMGADVPTSLALVFEEAKSGRRATAVAFTQTLLLTGVIVTQAIGFLVAGMGPIAGRILFVHPFLVAMIVWFLRRGIAESPAWQQAVRGSAGRERRSLKVLLRPECGIALLSTALFLVFAAMTPNTLGQFSAYLITTVSGASTRVATAVGLAGTIIGVLSAMVFQRFADVPLGRRTLFIVGSLTFIAGPLVAVLAGFSVWSVVVMYIVTSIGGTCAGEGLYKIWTQEIFPTAIRSTAQGVTYSAARFVSAGFGLLTPALAIANPALLMEILAATGLIAGLIGLLWVPRLARHGDDVDAHISDSGRSTPNNYEGSTA